MKKFIDDDIGYLDWIDRNHQGFVVNTYRNPSSKCLILHRAACGTISTSKRTNWTTRDYIKICSLRRTELEEWGKREVGENPKPCQICDP